jgi:hypothetical protein
MCSRTPPKFEIANSHCFPQHQIKCLSNLRDFTKDNREGVKGVDGVCVIRFPNALDGPRDIKSLIGYFIDFTIIIHGFFD